MLNEAQFARMAHKVKRFEAMLEKRLLNAVDTVSISAFTTPLSLYEIPKNELFNPLRQGDTWGGEKQYCWMKGQYTVPSFLEQTPLYLRPKVGGYEALLFVNGVAAGTFCNKITITDHGNHYFACVATRPRVGETLDLCMEWYAGHYVKGTKPFTCHPKKDFTYTYDCVEICTLNEAIAAFYFDLKTLNELYFGQPENSNLNAMLAEYYLQLHQVLYYDLDNATPQETEYTLCEGAGIVRKALQQAAGETAGECGVCGHSHMDTAWLWDTQETIKKCARTFSNQLSLMERYPEYRFVQSSAYHTQLIEQHYPALFTRICAAVQQGKYEQNGAVYVECDCNIPCGEMIARQFLWGQRYYKKTFGAVCDCFWLPDTFGYSAALPQIMRQSRVSYFLTTKMAWNDTTVFPYDTFYWQGIDKSCIFTHFNRTHLWPSPADILPMFADNKQGNSVKQKAVANAKLVAYGFGDGGGGPQFEMIEMARRCKNLKGCPKVETTSVSSFMRKLEQTAQNPNTYAGELYLELHRGTLTNQHEIKYLHYKAEQALHLLEFTEAAWGVRSQSPASAQVYENITRTLLVNEFHDILPGTCIPSVHCKTRRELKNIAAVAQKKAMQNMQGTQAGVINACPFVHDDVIYLPADTSGVPVHTQRVQCTQNVQGELLLAAQGAALQPYSVAATINPKDLPACNTPFVVTGNRLETPFAIVEFDENGFLSSVWDKCAHRQLCTGARAWNTFLFGEDVSASWDSWDIDADLVWKLRPTLQRVSTHIVSTGCIEHRIRNTYRITEKSLLVQDVVFYAHTPLIVFDTLIHWQEEHRYLKTVFDTSIVADYARSGIQFGCIQRAATANTLQQQACFEAVQHKYTDIAEPSFGIALFSEAKYGVSATDGTLGLSLHKGGVLPDYTGDKGTHGCRYGIYPHNSGFGCNAVVRPAYLFGNQPLFAACSKPAASLASCEGGSAVLETIKPCEDKQPAIILRLYEAEGSYTETTVHLGFSPVFVQQTNLLEEAVAELFTKEKFTLALHPFEIVTLKIGY